MQLIPLSQNKFAMVDDAVFASISQYKWHYMSGGYAVRRDSFNRPIYMHRQIVDAKESEYVDHKNHNKLDNQSFNLRKVTPQQSVMNRRVQKNNKAGIKGVRFDRDRNKWSARIGLNGKTIHLGRFETKERASQAYAKAAPLIHGEHACIN